MRRLLFLLVLTATATLGRAAPTTMDPHEVVKAIDLFDLDPASTDAENARAIIVNFAQKSPSVVVAMSRDLLPWAHLERSDRKDEPDADSRNLLIIAYLAGNVRSQLEAGHPKDDPYAGWLQVIATYDQLRRLNPEVKINEVDNMKKDQANNKLRSRADKALAHEQAEEARPAH